MTLNKIDIDTGPAVTRSEPRLSAEEEDQPDLTMPMDGLPSTVLQMRNQECFYVRHINRVLVVDHETHEVFCLKWKTFNRNKRKGKELDPRAFSE